MATAAGELESRSFMARELGRIKVEGLAVVIASASLVVTVAALMVAALAISDAKEANIRTELQSQEIQALRDEVGVLEIRIVNAENE